MSAVIIKETKLLFWSDGFALNQKRIFVHPDSKNKEGLIAHEKVHQGQMKEAGTWTFWWRYLTSSDHRLKYEVEAYKESLRFVPDIYRAGQLTKFAQYLVDLYFLDITLEEAKKLLMEP